MSTIKHAARWIGAACLACLAAGCSPGPFDVEVILDENDEGLKGKMGQTTQSIEVNLVGVNETDYRRWEQMSMNNYWEPDSKVRTSAKKFVMTFGEGKPSTQVLSRNDPIWKEWINERKASYLFVLAYLPWITQDAPGDADRRRIILPLERGRWEWSAWGALKIPIELRAEGMTALRQPKKK